MRLAGRWLAAFALANLLCWPLLPGYAALLAPWVGSIWNVLAAADNALHWQTLEPLRWTWESGLAGQQSGRMWTWNLTLLLTGLAAVDGLTWRQRLIGLPAGIGALAIWHVFDLLLSMESQWLTLHQPEGYNLASPSLWFLLIKFLNNLTVLGLRQLVPLLLVAAAWQLARLRSKGAAVQQPHHGADQQQ